MASLLLFISLLIAFCTGCTVTKYESPTGEKFSRTAWGNRTSVGTLVVEADARGVRKITLKGYSNDQAEVAGAVTQAAVEAALKAAK